MKEAPEQVFRTCEGWLNHHEGAIYHSTSSRTFLPTLKAGSWTDQGTNTTYILTEAELSKIDKERRRIWNHQFGILFEAERKKFEKRHKASLEGEKLRIDAIADIKCIFDRTFHPEPLDQISRNLGSPPPHYPPYYQIKAEFILPTLPKVTNHQIWDMREANRMIIDEDFQPFWLIGSPDIDLSGNAMMKAEVYKALARWLEFSYMRWEGNPNMYHPIGMHAGNLFHEAGYTHSLALADPIRYIAMPTEGNRAIYLNRWGISSRSGLTALSLEEINAQVHAIPDSLDRIKLLFKIREAFDVNDLVMFNLDKPVYRSLIRAMFDAWPKINHERFMQWWEEKSGWTAKENQSPAPQQSPRKSKPKNAQPSYVTLRDIFKEPDRMEEFLTVLRKVEPPVTNKKGHFILSKKQKEALVIFFEVLFKKGHTKTNNGRHLSPLIEEVFNEKISARSFGNRSESEIMQSYRTQFKTLTD